MPSWMETESEPAAGVVLVLSAALWGGYFGFVVLLGLRQTLSGVSGRERVYTYLQESAHSRAIAVGDIVFGLSSCAIYIRETVWSDVHGREVEPPFWMSLAEIAFSMFFTCNFLMQLYVAQQRLAFLRSTNAMVDILTVTPVIFYVLILFFHERHERRSEDLQNWIIFFRMLRMIRLFKIANVTANTISDAISHQMFKVVADLLAALVVVTSLVQFLSERAGQDYGERLTFIDSLYFTFSTVSTVGYGDISPVHSEGRMVVVALIMLLVVHIPMQTNALSALFELRSQYDGTYKRYLGEHIVICADPTCNALRTFLEEFFHSDHGLGLPRVVLVVPAEPDFAWKELLLQYSSHSKVTYLKGDIMRKRDLLRSRIMDCKACFVLTDRLAKDTIYQDSLTFLRALSVRTFAPSVPLFVQVIEPEVRHHFYSLGVRRNKLASVKHLKMQLLAQSVLWRGFAAVMTNMVHTLSVSETYEAWQADYVSGLNKEIYVFPVGKAFAGVPFNVCAKQLMMQFEVILLAVSSVVHGVLLNPGKTYKVTPTDLGYILGQNSSICNEIMARLCPDDPDLYLSPHHEPDVTSVNMQSHQLSKDRQESFVDGDRPDEEEEGDPAAGFDEFTPPSANQPSPSVPVPGTADSEVVSVDADQDEYTSVSTEDATGSGVGPSADARAGAVPGGRRTGTGIEAKQQEQDQTQTHPTVAIAPDGDTAGATARDQVKPPRSPGFALRAAGSASHAPGMAASWTKKMVHHLLPASQKIVPEGAATMFSSFRSRLEDHLASHSAHARRMSMSVDDTMALRGRGDGTSPRGSESLEPSVTTLLEALELHQEVLMRIDLTGHLIVCCSTLDDIYLAVRALRSGFNTYRPILILCPLTDATHAADERGWLRLEHASDLYIVQGHPTSVHDLERARLKYARGVIVTPVNPVQTLSSELPGQLAIDSSTVLSVVSIVEHKRPDTEVVTELHEMELIPHFGRVTRGITDRSMAQQDDARMPQSQPHELDRSYARGDVVLSHFSDLLICQSFYDNSLLPLIMVMLNGYPRPKPGDHSPRGANVCQIPLPHAYIAQMRQEERPLTFGALYDWLLDEHETLAFALYHTHHRRMGGRRHFSTESDSRIDSAISTEDEDDNSVTHGIPPSPAKRRNSLTGSFAQGKERGGASFGDSGSILSGGDENLDIADVTTTYVVTSPRPDRVLTRDDRVFVLIRDQSTFDKLKGHMDQYTDSTCAEGLARKASTSSGISTPDRRAREKQLRTASFSKVDQIASSVRKLTDKLVVFEERMAQLIPDMDLKAVTPAQRAMERRLSHRVRSHSMLQSQHSNSRFSSSSPHSMDLDLPVNNISLTHSHSNSASSARSSGQVLAPVQSADDEDEDDAEGGSSSGSGGVVGGSGGGLLSSLQAAQRHVGVSGGDETKVKAP